jgi:hypothetical protein
MPKFILSAHAETVIAERGIDLQWIDRVLANPERTEKSRNDPAVRYALGQIPEHDNRVLRVVYNGSVEPVRVITVYFDRTLKGTL